MKKVFTLVSVSCICLSVIFLPIGTCNKIPATVEAKKCVYYATSSKKFHSNKYCRTLARSKKIYKVTKKKAKRIGLTPCKVCH